MSNFPTVRVKITLSCRTAHSVPLTSKSQIYQQSIFKTSNLVYKIQSSFDTDAFDTVLVILC